MHFVGSVALSLGIAAVALVAWRRLARSPARAAEFRESLKSLRWYWRGVGGSAPFVSLVLDVPLGELDENLCLLAHWRIETMASDVEPSLQ